MGLLSPVWRIDEAPDDGKRLDYVHWEGGPTNG
jgi:hypothetical protein